MSSHGLSRMLNPEGVNPTFEFPEGSSQCHFRMTSPRTRNQIVWPMRTPKYPPTELSLFQSRPTKRPYSLRNPVELNFHLRDLPEGRASATRSSQARIFASPATSEERSFRYQLNVSRGLPQSISTWVRPKVRSSFP